ncbi:MAG: carboxypeptidase-like regulatory domain-containing protein, partial [Bryobacteraceae bacterium]
MVVMRFVALFVCVVTSAVIAPAVEKASLEGRVVHAQTGEPVRKATLTLRGATSRGGALSAVSDAGGHFLIRDITPGTYKLTADHTGFLRQEYGARGARSSGVSITLSDGQNSRDLEFRLTPQGVITGKVLDDDGEPLQRATLSGWIVTGKVSGGQATSAGSATTNDIGEFRLAGLAPGRYLLSASMRRSSFRGEQVVRGDGGGQEDFVPTYYPGVTDRASAATIEVPPGQEVSGIRIQLRKSPVYRVSGTVAATPAPNGRSLRVMLVSRQASAGSPGFGSSGMVQKDGGFDITGVLPGSYYAVAMGGEGRPRVVGKLPVDVTSGNLDNLVIPGGQPVSLNGSMRVEGDDKASVRSASVELMPESMVAFQTPPARVKED